MSLEFFFFKSVLQTFVTCNNVTNVTLSSLDGIWMFIIEKGISNFFLTSKQRIKKELCCGFIDALNHVTFSLLYIMCAQLKARAISCWLQFTKWPPFSIIITRVSEFKQ